MMAAIRSVGLCYGLVMIWVVPLQGETWVWPRCVTTAHLVYLVLLIESYRLGDMSVV